MGNISTTGDTTKMEGTHGELSSRFTDTLGGNDANGNAFFHGLVATEIEAVAFDTNAFGQFALEHGADMNFGHAIRGDETRCFFGHDLAFFHDRFAIGLHCLKNKASENAIRQFLSGQF